jgi:O-antigen/teichoic acid export membrane protein
LKSKRIKDAKKELENVENRVQEAALQLASSTLYLYKPPAILWWLILLIILAIALAILAYWYWKRRKRRPKLLQRVEETEK